LKMVDLVSGIEQAIDRAKTEEIVLNSKARIFLSDVRILNPALDCNPDHLLLITIPFPGIVTKENKKTKEKTEHPDMILCVITDKREIYEANDSEFMKRNLLARVPSPVITQRWTAESVKQWIKGNEPYGQF
jgi:hypothetical protein